MRINLNKNKCAKQTVVAIIESKGEYFIGTNSCKKPQSSCPRGSAPSGIDYSKCINVCKQEAHAEINALKEAKGKAKGGTLYLLGHFYVCDKCQKALDKAKINNVVILSSR